MRENFVTFSPKSGLGPIFINNYNQSCSINFPCCSFTGKERDEELNEKLEEELSYRYPMTDFSFIDGGQEIYRWIAGIG